MNTESTFKSMIIAAFTGCLLVVACETKNKMDSDQVAEEKNEAKFEGKAQKDAEFISDVAKINISEVRLAELAEKRALSSSVKEYAALMVEHHRKMYKETADYAQKNNISIPDTIAKADIAGYDNLKDKSGAEFDTKFVDAMVDDHKKTIDKFEDVGASDQYNQEINSIASQTLPMLRTHYEKAKELQDKMKEKK